MIDLELVKESESIELELEENSKGGTKNYNELDNKPQINGKELTGNLTLEDLGIIVNAVKDVLINGASIIDENGNAVIPIASETVEGVAKVMKSHGIKMNTNTNALTIAFAEENQIRNRNSQYNPIVPKTLGFSVKCAMTDGKDPEWTPQEQAMARKRMGIGEWTLLGDITVEEDGVSMIEIPIDNPNYNEYQFYVYVAERKNTTATSVIVGLNRITSTQYALSYGGVGTGATYHFKGHTIRHCEQGWFTNSLGSADGKPCNGVNSKAVDYYGLEVSGAYKTTEKPETINVSLATGLDIGSRFVVYAR